MGDTNISDSSNVSASLCEKVTKLDFQFVLFSASAFRLSYVLIGMNLRADLITLSWCFDLIPVTQNCTNVSISHLFYRGPERLVKSKNSPLYFP